MYLYGVLATACTFALGHFAARGCVRYTSLSVPALCIAFTSAILGTVLIAHDRSIEGVCGAIVLAACACASATDICTGYIFDLPTVASLCVAAVLQYAGGHGLDATAGAVLCVTLLGAIWVLTQGRGIGLGDVKLASVIGCGLGFSASLHALQIAFVAGGAVAAWKLLLGRGRRGDTMPFGPYLAGGAACLSIAGMLR